MTHQTHPESIIGTGVPSWWCTFCGSDKCIRTHTHRYGILQNPFTALEILCARPVHPSLPEPLAATDHFTVSVVVPFPKCDIAGSTQDVAFSDGLLSLSHLH